MGEAFYLNDDDGYIYEEGEPDNPMDDRELIEIANRLTREVARVKLDPGDNFVRAVAWRHAMARAETAERELDEARENKRVETVRLDWLLDTLRGAHSPTWTRDNFIKGSSNAQVRESIDASLPYDKRAAREGEGEKS